MPNQFLYILIILFLTFQFSISTQFSFIWTIDRILSGATTPGESGHESDGNKVVLCTTLAQSARAVEYTNCISAEG